MSAKRQAEHLEENSPAKKQKLSNGVTSNGAEPAQAKPALPAMEAIAKAKRALELQKQLKAKLEAAKLKVQLTVDKMA